MNKLLIVALCILSPLTLHAVRVTNCMDGVIRGSGTVTGTSGTIGKFTAGTTIGDSIMTESGDTITAPNITATYSMTTTSMSATQVFISSTPWSGGGLLTVGGGSTPALVVNSDAIIFNGNIGVNISSPSFAIHAFGNIVSSGTSAQVRAYARSGNPGFYQYVNDNAVWGLYTDASTNDFHIRDSANASNKLSIMDSTGHIGISSSTTPIYLLTMEAGGVGGYYDESDHQWHNGVSFSEYKENIADIKLANPITSLKNVKLRKYNYKGQKKVVYGYLADELPKNLARYMIDDNGGLSMNGLFVYATATMKAQQEKIESLEARIAKLEKLIK